ncbi:MAG: ATP-dependent helicase [Candidatus Gastranaerophilales bacterium]
MIIKGDLSSNKTQMLIEKYAQLLNSGIKSSEILVLVQNSNKKAQFVEKTLELLDIECYEKLQVHSFFSLVFNTIQDNWAYIENLNPYQNPTILPNLAGLEVSQFILKDILREVTFKGYNSKKSLLHQIFRRYSLIVQNNLNDEDIEWRSKILNEGFADDVKDALKKMLAKTLSLRDFDYLRQSLVFNHVYKNTKYFKDIKYLILDDGDEVTPICYDFVEYLSKQLLDVFVAYDELGGSRAGYLSADRTAVWKYEELFNEKSVELVASSRLKSDAMVLYSNIVEDKFSPLENFVINSPSKRSSMINDVIVKINELVSKNISVSEISVITPVIDDMLKFTLRENLKLGVKPIFLSGSEKLAQNKIVQAALTILKLQNDLKYSLTEFDLRVIFTNFLGIPVKYCQEILENFEQHKTFVTQEFELEEYKIKYEGFLALLNKLECSEAKTSEKVCDIYEELVNFRFVSVDEVNKFNFFVKQLQDFENIFGENFKERESEIITQIENSIIAENPYMTLQFEKNELVIATPQKIIDNQIRTKYQFWLDVSSSEWVKSDTGPLYNAWVFQRGWNKDEFSVEDNISLSNDKTAKILRKLTLCADEKIFACSSLFDTNGVENFGGIENNIVVRNNLDLKISEVKPFVIIPRDDQKPVLDYEVGKMAISAVPGAGKTFILLALIVKLLDMGVNSENIFVMTYMESAARNFRERIKTIRQNSNQLPNISTIHGLALRILKENSNFERLGLSGDFEICDDTQRGRIIKNLATQAKLKKTEMDEFDRGISIYKIGCGVFENITDKKVAQFQKFYEQYQLTLSELNLIDYDDILLSSVKLLEQNSDILAYYQDICKYIIEDEAQDSSAIQQRLINLLSAKQNNLIRCGDINQAITTTFSNADVAGFRDFIAKNQSVSMNRSQRCSKDVWTLANRLVSWALVQDGAEAGLFEIYMREVEGKNPVSENAIHANIFPSTNDERNFVLKQIKMAFKKNPQSTIAILARSNFQVAQWSNFLNNSGLKSITRSECLEQKSIFRTIFAIMRIVENPFDNNVVADSYDVLAEVGIYKQRQSVEIKKYEKSFVSLNCDDIENVYLSQYYWDLSYWLSFSHLSAEELAIKIGLHYYSSEIEKSNVYLISTLIKRLSTNDKNFKTLMSRLKELGAKNNLSGFKFFSEEDENNKDFLAGKVQIMTLHKSKGDEFDYVFIPELSEKSLTLDYEQIKVKSAEFSENLKRLNPNYRRKSEHEIKLEHLFENIRLLYVAITRAKKQLYFSASTKVQSFGKTIEQKPSLIFEELLASEVQYVE